MNRKKKRLINGYRRKDLKFISISLPDKEYQIIEKFCTKNNINRSEFVRNIIIERIKKTEEKKWRKKLNH